MPRPKIPKHLCAKTSYRARFAFHPDRKPWEQQIGESDRHFTAFKHYLMLGPNRTIELAERKFKVSNQVSAPCKWVDRATAYDLNAINNFEVEHQALLTRFKKGLTELVAVTTEEVLEAKKNNDVAKLKKMMPWVQAVLGAGKVGKFLTDAHPLLFPQDSGPIKGIKSMQIEFKDDLE